MKLRIHDLEFSAGYDIGSANLSLTPYLQPQLARLALDWTQAQRFHIQQEFYCILLHIGQGGELMFHPFNPNPVHRCSSE